MVITRAVELHVTYVMGRKIDVSARWKIYFRNPPLVVGVAICATDDRDGRYIAIIIGCVRKSCC